MAPKSSMGDIPNPWIPKYTWDGKDDKDKTWDEWMKFERLYQYDKARDDYLRDEALRQQRQFAIEELARMAKQQHSRPPATEIGLACEDKRICPLFISCEKKNCKYSKPLRTTTIVVDCLSEKDVIVLEEVD